MSYTNAVNIEIDGKKLDAEAGSMIIEAADRLGVRIPRFCYHKKLSIAANCRMCLVEVANAPKPLPACATPISEGMIIKTASSKAIEAQRSVMEFLLINHPLDCPVCDQGGECELQDVAMGYGSDLARFSEEKRVVVDSDLGPFIATDMTRCIHCTRCVRFGEEVAGIREMGATGRGEHMQIGTFVEKAVSSEVSGNIIDLCPVGALTSKPFRFKARAWELKQYPGVAAHDALGSNVYWHVWNNKVVRTVPREQESINEIWLSDRDRFSYQGLHSIDRILEPRVFSEGLWQPACWESALSQTAEWIAHAVESGQQNEMALLLSPNCTVEEAYLAQKLMRALGVNQIDHRLYQQDFSADKEEPMYPQMGVNIDALAEQDWVVCIGADVQREQPLLSIRLFQATQNHQTQVMLVHPMDLETAFPVAAKNIPARADLVQALLGISVALSLPIPEAVGKIQPSEADKACALALKSGGKMSFLLGQLAISHPQWALIRSLTAQLADFCGASLGVLTPGANSAGAWISGAVPHRGPHGMVLSQKGGTLSEILEKDMKVLILVNVEPEYDAIQSAEWLNRIEEADKVIAISAYLTPHLLKYADVILPMVPFSETSGTFVNANGVWQTFHPALEPMGQARPLWKILRVLGTCLHAEGFDYQTRESVLEELKAGWDEKKVLEKRAFNFPTYAQSSIENQHVVAVLPMALYGTDAVVRRAPALQQMQGKANLRLNQKMVTRLGLKENWVLKVDWLKGASVTLPWVIDNGVPDEVVVIPAGLSETKALGASYHPVKLQAIERSM